MSKITVKTPAQLRHFLQVLAEESVGQARSAMDARSQQAKIAQDIKTSKSRFMQEDDLPSTDTVKPDAPASSPQESPKDETKPPPPPPAAGKDAIEPKLGDLIDAINLLRGVPSAKDSNIEDLLRTYFDTLTTAEAAALVVMLRSISNVMDGKVGAIDAKDPRDYDIQTNFSKGSENKTAEKMGSTITPAGPVKTEPSQSAEKIEPPIKVGQPAQVSESYREKIRQLLGKA